MSGKSIFDRTEEHRSFKGLPLVGRTKEILGERTNPPHRTAFLKTGTFRTWDAEDMKKYEEVMTKHIFNKYSLTHELVQEVPGKGWLIFARWKEWVFVTPSYKREHMPDE